MVGAQSVGTRDRPTGHVLTDSATLDAGIRALIISSVGLLVTCIIQIAVVWVGQSAALLADALHNLVDVFTSIPLWIAFALSRRLATRRFTYGYARAEDLAGATIILFIVGSAILAGYRSEERRVG